MSRAWLPEGFEVLPPKPHRQRRTPPAGAPVPAEHGKQVANGGAPVSV